MTTIARTRLALAVALLSVPLLAAAQQLSPVGTREGVNPLESGYVFNIVDWDGGKVPRSTPWWRSRATGWLPR